MSRKIQVASEDPFASPLSDIFYFHRRGEIYRLHAIILLSIVFIAGGLYFGMLFFFYDETTAWRWYILAIQIFACGLHLGFSLLQLSCQSKVILALEAIVEDEE